MWGVCCETQLENVARELFLKTDLNSREADFKDLIHISQRVDFVYDRIKETDTFKNAVPDECQIRKSNEKSQQSRLDGNNCFVRYKNHLEAIELYTKSVALAENESSYLALAYANRSAVLFEGKYYNECLQDIERALTLDYPENLKSKLNLRKEKAESLIPQQKTLKYHDDLPVINKKNPQLPSTSASVKVKYNERIGQHIVAIKNIKIGEVISVEQALTHTIHAQSEYLHCYECLKICYNMIPCKNCPSALYCSEECRSKGYEGYHKYECQFLVVGDMFFIKLALLGMEETKKIESQVPETYNQNSFKEIIKLAMKDESRNYSNLCIPAIAASFAYHVLKKNSEFLSDYNSDADDQNLKEYLYKAYLVESFHSFTINKFRNTNRGMLATHVATGIYGFTSFYKHSCVPNCVYYNFGSQIVVRAQTDINKGEQVTLSYGVGYGTVPRPIRRALIKKRYNIECDCRACVLKWPTRSNLRLGKHLPIEFAVNATICCLGDNDTEAERMFTNKLLSEGKRLHYGLKRLEPSQNLLNLQELMYELYSKFANRDVDF